MGDGPWYVLETVVDVEESEEELDVEEDIENDRVFSATKPGA